MPAHEDDEVIEATINVWTAGQGYSSRESDGLVDTLRTNSDSDAPASPVASLGLPPADQRDADQDATVPVSPVD